MYIHTTGNFGVDIIISIVMFVYDLYKMSPLYIKILFWILILALIIWITIIFIKKNNPITTNPKN